MIKHNQTNTVVTPAMVEFPWNETVEFDTQFHTVLGRTPALPDVTLRPAGPRTGIIRAHFLTLAAAQTANAALRVSGSLTLTDSQVPGGSIVFTPTSLRFEQLDQRWVLVIAFVEVAG